MAAADVYFKYCHNQPYSLFHEGSFRRKLKNGTVPRALLFAFLATAHRFSSNSMNPKNDGNKTASLAATAWDAITLPWSQSTLEYQVALPMIQAVHLLSILDYTGKSAERSRHINDVESEYTGPHVGLASA
jgi:hypothetical protein